MPADGDLPTVCILAGGLATRLGARAERTPKALMTVAGEPFIFHQLRLLAVQGFERVVVCVGHLGEQIRSTTGDSRFGLEIAYSSDSPGLDGTLGAIRRASPLLGERFLLMYGDTFLRADFAGFHQQWVDSRMPAGMVVLHNRGHWGRSNVMFERDAIRLYDKESPTPEMEWIDYGLGTLTAPCLTLVPAGERDLAALYRHLSLQAQLFGFETTERFYEIGTPEALEEASAFLDSWISPGRA